MSSCLSKDVLSASKGLRVTPVVNRVPFRSSRLLAPLQLLSSPHKQCAAASATNVKEEQQTIENLTTDYCTDFECTSSPAVEQTVRSFARDLQRLRWTLALFNGDVKYQDGFRSFTGKEKYARQRWYADNIQQPIVTISRMQMLDKGTAQLNWRITGNMGAMPADISVTTVIEMNLLTGRIISHKDTWDLSRMSPPAALLANAGRLLWSAKQASKDASEGVGKKVTESLSSLDGEDASQYYNNPSDPTRFFQNQQDNQFGDAVALCTVIALMYLVFRAFSELAKLG